MLRCLDHVIVAVTDLEAATRSYARLLGRRPSWRGEHPGAGTANTLFRLENTTLELLAVQQPGPIARALEGWLAAHGEGPLGLAFGVEDAVASRAWLAARGLEPEPAEEGIGRDVDSGALRRWTRVPLPLSRSRGVVLFAIAHASPPELLPPAGLAADEPATVQGLDHAVLQTPDAEAARALYGDGLGLRLALDRAFAAWGVRLLFFRIGSLTVELAARLGEPPQPDADDRLWGLSYRVPDAEAAHRRLGDEGFALSEVRAGRRPGTRVFTVRDGTHGVRTLMLEPPHPGG